MEGLRIVQLALNTSDLAGTLRLYSEAFGFRNAGGNALWGETIRIQGLDPEARSMIWWLVGAQPQFQLELFCHSHPPQRPQPEDWRPSDPGWARFGIRVADLAVVEKALSAWRIAVTGRSEDGRRLAFRDPFVGAVVEAIADHDKPGPGLAYVACNVLDLASARNFFESRLGFAVHPIEAIHRPEDEEMWGLEGANREGFVVLLGDIALEMMHYATPTGRPRSADASITDQGIMNVGLGAPNAGVVRNAIAAFIADGCEPTLLFDNGDNLGTYFTRPDREFELLTVNPEYDEMLGFKPAFPFLATLAQ